MANNETAIKIPLDLICLRLLFERDMYGYEIVQTLEARSGDKLRVNLASVYVSLKRLSDKGFLTSYTAAEEDMPTRVRVFYHLEPSAIPYLQELQRAYEQTVSGLHDFFESCAGVSDYEEN